MGKTNEDDKEYEEEMFKSSIDSCRVAKGILGNYIIKMITDHLVDFSNFSFKCPQLKGFYYATNFPCTNNYLPFRLIARERKFQLTVVMKGKVNNSIGLLKSMVHFFTLKFEGKFQA